jgi:hypothetical protein
MFHPLPSLTRFAVATLLLTAGLLFTGGRADAGCGEPMLTLGHAGHDNPDHGPAKPCHGPNCSAAPGPTPAPISFPPKVSPTSEQWATHAFVAQPGSDGDSFRAIPSSFGRPVRRSICLLDPPRFA